MKDIVKEMWTGILNESDPEPKNTSFVPSVPEEEAGTYTAYLTVANDKNIYSTEQGQRGFAVRKAGEEVGAAWSKKLGEFEATNYTSFEKASELFGDAKIAWLEDGIA